MKTRMMIVGATLLVACAAIQLPAPPTPEPIAPALPVGAPPPPGMGQVTVDSVGEPALVTELTGHTLGGRGGGYHPIYRTVCTSTPCVANLSLGLHTLRLTSLHDGDHGGDGLLSVSSEPSLYRYALGHNQRFYRRHIAGAIVTVLGLQVGVLGIVGLAHGTQTADDRAWMTTGIVLSIAAGSSLIAGILLLATPDKEQKGAGIQWTRN